jgi:hypothetical protein
MPAPSTLPNALFALALAVSFIAHPWRRDAVPAPPRRAFRRRAAPRSPSSKCCAIRWPHQQPRGRGDRDPDRPEVLDLPAPWALRVDHLWFITLGAQLALYLHRAIAVTARATSACTARAWKTTR